MKRPSVMRARVMLPCSRSLARMTGARRLPSDVADAGAQRLRHDVAIGLGDRLEHVAVGDLVHLEHGAVGGFEGVVGLAELGQALGVVGIGGGWRSRRGAQHEGEREATQDRGREGQHDGGIQRPSGAWNRFPKGAVRQGHAPA